VSAEPYYVDILCSRDFHRGNVVRRYRFVYYPTGEGWKWMEEFNRRQAYFDPQTQVPSWIGPLQVRDGWEPENGGDATLSLDCRCGLHQPVKWQRLMGYLERARLAGEHDMDLPALVAILTQSHRR
jgi:hypothetical protein